jgi:hypothetical protein
MTSTINESQDAERDLTEVEWKGEGVESPVHSPWKHVHEGHRAMHLFNTYTVLIVTIQDQSNDCNKDHD